jgi:hypothetical protein
VCRIGLSMVCLVAALAPFSTHAGNAWDPFTSARVYGQVRDLDTGAPVPGAIVIAVWEAYAVTGTFCFDTDATVSDEQGRYTLPPWTLTWRNWWAMPDKTLRIDAYAPGYVGEFHFPGVAAGRSHHEDVYLHRTGVTELQRVRYMYLLDGEHGLCRSVFQGANATHETHFRVLWQQMAEESEALATSIPEAHTWAQMYVREAREASAADPNGHR